MKQTNNAIKFLMAQYRAIFQNAYFKGLATAVVVTMGLAAGQAQAAASDKNLDADELSSATGEIIITGENNDKGTENKWGALNISGAANTEIGYDLKITGSAKGDNYITSDDTGNAVVTGKVLTIEVASDKVKDNGLTVKGTAQSGATAVFTTANIKAGTLDINAKDSTQSGSFAANTINIGTASSSNQKATAVTTNAYVNLGDKATLGTALANNKLLSEMTTINLNKDGKIVALSGGAANLVNKINAAVFNVNGGSILIDATDSGSGSTSSIELASGTMTDGTLSITSGSSLAIAFTEHTIKKDANDTVGLEKKFDINSGTIDAKGNITVTGAGSVSVKDGVVLTGGKTGEEATFSFSGDGTNDPTLKTSTTQLDKIDDVTKVHLKNATLELTDDGQITLGATNPSITLANSAALNKIYADTALTIKAKDVLVDGAVDQGSVLTLNAENLTLAGTDASTVSSLNAKNVTFVPGKDDPYTLQETLTLSAVSGTGDQATAQQGTFAGDVVVSGGASKPLAIDGGIYEVDSLIKLSSGAMTVGSASSAANTTVTLSNLAIDNTNGGNSITVEGATGKEAVLNIVAADLDGKLTGHASNKTEVTVNEFGTLELTGDQLAQLINKNKAWGEGLDTGAGILINNGTVDTLETSIDTELSVDDLTSGTSVTANKITFHNANGGTLNTQSLSLKDNNTPDGLDIGPGTIDVGGSLTLTAKDASGDFVVNTGNLVLGKEVKSGNNAKLVIGKSGTSAAKLDLGSVWVENEAVQHSADKGQVRVDLALAGQSATTNQKSELNVKYGQWSAQEINAEFADINIGYDVSNEATAIQKLNHNWGLTADKLVVGTTNAANVNVEQNINGSTAEQELVVNDLAVKTGSKITLKGDMTLNGKLNDQGDTDATNDTYGVELVAKAIDVQAGGFLTIQNDALNAIKIEGDTVTLKGYEAGSIASATGSTVKLNFADDYGVISDQALQELRKKLFGLTNDTDKLDGTLSIGGAQISGLEVNEKGEIAWDKVDTNKDVVTDVTNDALTNAKVTGVDSGDAVRGTFGSMTSTTLSSEFGNKITTDERLTLGNASANEGYFAAQVDNDGKVIGALGFDVKADTDLTLKNGGQAAEVALQSGAGLVVDGGQAKTTLTKVSGKDGEVTLKSGALEVTDKAGVVVSVLNSEAGSSLTAQKFTTDEAVIKGDLNISGKTTIAGDAQFSGVNTFGGAFTAKNAEFNGGKTVFAEGQTAKIANNLDVVGGSSVDVKGVLEAGNIFVGESVNEAAQTEGSNGTLTVERLDLAGGSLVVDPEFTKASSFVGVNEFGPTDVVKDDEAGIVNGKVYALQNAIVSIGNKDEAAVKSVFAKFVEADGSLQDPNVKGNENGVGAIAYVAKKFELADGSKLVVDPSATDRTYTQKTYSGDIFVGSNAALAIDVSALADDTKAAITLGKNTNATVYVQDNEKSKMYITGSLSDIKGEINLFDTKNGTGTVTLTLGNGEKFRVQTINGLFYKEFANGANLADTITELDFNNIEADKQFSVVSEPVKKTLMSLGYGYNDYELPTAERKDLILGHRAEGYYVNDQGKFFTTADFQPDSEVSQLDVDKLGLVSETIDGKVVAYYKDNNALLNNILVNGGNAVDAETVARLAVFGGAPQAAIEAGASTYEAISARMGVGVSGVSAAANGQGGAIWVTPVYKSAESDGFAADNKSYGADVKLYGLALGADIEVAPNFKVGGMFNVGSGDADGQGLGANVSNDFDYYGLGLYAGYSMDAFSLVADVTYTAVDNDIEGNTDLGKVNASIDSTNLSVGVTGQYKLSVAGMDVTPHAGVRFSKLDIDDYTTEYAQSSSDSLNIFSVPVGVTIAKEYVTDTWTVKPSFDLTLTGNFGDDEFEGNAQWATFSNLSTNVKSEIMDNFTYGAAVGVSATTGNFGLGLGVNYTGSSNTDEFGVNANARYMF